MSSHMCTGIPEFSRLLPNQLHQDSAALTLGQKQWFTLLLHCRTRAIYFLGGILWGCTNVHVGQRRQQTQGNWARNICCEWRETEIMTYTFMESKERNEGSSQCIMGSPPTAQAQLQPDERKDSGTSETALNICFINKINLESNLKGSEDV